MSLARTPSTTAGLLRSGAGDAAGLHLVPEPSRVMTALVADLLWPTSLDPALQREEVRGRLLGLLRHLLAARRITVLQREHAHTSYAVWRADAAGVLQPTGDIVPVQAAPLPFVTALGGGVLLEHPPT